MAKKGNASNGNDNVPALWDEELARYAQEDSARAATGLTGRTLSTRGRKFGFQGTNLPDQLNMVILDWVFYNSYYTGGYDPDRFQPPGCFALAPKLEELHNHELSPAPQGGPEIDTGNGTGLPCKTCWANAFGTADQGKGKACKNGARLALIDVDMKLDEAIMLTIPPTGMKNWMGYVQGLAKVTNLPVFAVNTMLEMDDKETWPIVKFTKVEPITDKDVVARIMAERRDSAARTFIMTPPDVSNYGQEEVQKPKGRMANRRAVARPAPAAQPAKTGGFGGKAASKPAASGTAPTRKFK